MNDSLLATGDEVPGTSGLVAEIRAAIGSITSAGRKQDDYYERRARFFQALHQSPVKGVIPIAAGAGVLVQPDGLGAPTGYYWSVRRIVLTGYTAGTVTVFKNAVVLGGAVSAGNEILLPAQPSGTFTFGRGEMLIEPDGNMVFTAAGIVLATGFPGVQIDGSADIFEAQYLPDYLL